MIRHRNGGNRALRPVIRGIPSRMPRSIVLFIVLAAAGLLAGITLSNRAPSPGSAAASAPPPTSAPRLGDAADAMAVLARKVAA